MRIAHSLACAVLAVGLAGNAAAIVRCEAADGKITYSNSECPPKTRLVRKVDQSPPVIVHDGERPAGKNGEAPLPPRIEAAKPAPAPDPVRQDRELTAQIAAQQRECDARSRQLQHLRADLDAAPPAARSSAEMALRRAQDEYQALCANRR
jgi:hypothetical protein